MRCSVKLCFAVGKRTSFSLPTNPKTREKWLNFLRSSGRSVCESSEYRICEVHFEQSCIIENSKRKMLIAGSSPTLYKIEVFKLF